MLPGYVICGHFARPFVVHSYGYDTSSDLASLENSSISFCNHFDETDS